MGFVPMMHRPELSPRAEELARRINEAITAYRETHPDLTGEELQQAMMRAAMNTAPGASGPGSRRAVVLPVVAGLAVALGLGLYLASGERASGSSWPVLAIALGVIALAVVMFTIRRSSS